MSGESVPHSVRCRRKLARPSSYLCLPDTQWLHRRFSFIQCSALSKGVQIGHVKCIRLLRGRRRLGRAVSSHPGFPVMPPMMKDSPKITSSEAPISPTSSRPTYAKTRNAPKPNSTRVVRPRNNGGILAREGLDDISTPKYRTLFRTDPHDLSALNTMNHR